MRFLFWIDLSLVSGPVFARVQRKSRPDLGNRNDRSGSSDDASGTFPLVRHGVKMDAIDKNLSIGGDSLKTWTMAEVLSHLRDKRVVWP